MHAKIYHPLPVLVALGLLTNCTGTQDTALRIDSPTATSTSSAFTPSSSSSRSSTESPLSRGSSQSSYLEDAKAVPSLASVIGGVSKVLSKFSVAKVTQVMKYFTKPSGSQTHMPLPISPEHIKQRKAIMSSVEQLARLLISTLLGDTQLSQKDQQELLRRFLHQIENNHKAAEASLAAIMRESPQIVRAWINERKRNKARDILKEIDNKLQPAPSAPLPDLP